MAYPMVFGSKPYCLVGRRDLYYRPVINTMVMIQIKKTQWKIIVVTAGDAEIKVQSLGTLPS